MKVPSGRKIVVHELPMLVEHLRFKIEYVQVRNAAQQAYLGMHRLRAIEPLLDHLPMLFRIQILPERLYLDYTST